MKEKSARIVTEQLCLQTFLDRDMDDAVEILYNEEIKKTYMVPDFADREQAVRLFERLKTMSQSGEHFVYAIRYGDKLIGFINEVDKEDHMIEVGYVIHPVWQNKGFATQALQASIEELFRMGYFAVRAGIFEGNTASRRVIEKCGMRQIPAEEEIEYRGKRHRCIYFEVAAG